MSPPLRTRLTPGSMDADNASEEQTGAHDLPAKPSQIPPLPAIGEPDQPCTSVLPHFEGSK